MQVIRWEFNKRPIVDQVFNQMLEKYDTEEKLRSFLKALLIAFYKETMDMDMDTEVLKAFVNEQIFAKPSFDNSYEGLKDLLYGFLSSMDDEALKSPWSF